jgi:hypothetical protein
MFLDKSGGERFECFG